MNLSEREGRRVLEESAVLFNFINQCHSSTLIWFTLIFPRLQLDKACLNRIFTFPVIWMFSSSVNACLFLCAAIVNTWTSTKVTATPKLPRNACKNVCLPAVYKKKIRNNSHGYSFSLSLFKKQKQKTTFFFTILFATTWWLGIYISIIHISVIVCSLFSPLHRSLVHQWPLDVQYLISVFFLSPCFHSLSVSFLIL